MIYDAIIIGGGPAGLMASNVLENNHINYLLLEKNERVGKKLLISGGKRCNVTNNLTIENFIGSLNFKHRKFLYHALKCFGSNEIIEFFRGHQLNLVLEENLKYFPETQMSSSVLDSLLEDIKPQHIKLHSSVKKIQLEKNIYTIHTADETYQAKNLIIATGSNSYPTTGSSGDGIVLIKPFNIDSIPFTPAETHVFSKEVTEHYKDLQGVSLKNIKLKIIGTNKTYTGGLIFTHFGLSGPSVMHASEDIYQLLLEGKVSLSFQLVSQTREQLIHLFNDSQHMRTSLLSLLETLTTKRLAKKVCDLSNVENKNISELSKKDLNKVIEYLTNFTIEIDSVQTRDLSFVNAGGILTTELNPKTMESKKVEGLYFAGETVDLHGPIGGFNITIALSTGHLCATSILNKLKGEQT